MEDIIGARLCAHVAQLWEREAAPEWVLTGEGTWRDGHVEPSPRTGDDTASDGAPTAEE